MSSHVGQWNAAGINPSYFGGGEGNAVVVLMNSSLATVVLSGLTDQLVAYPALANAVGGSLAFGFNGRIAAVPPGHVLRSILVAGQGVNDTMHGWGNVLLQVGETKRLACITIMCGPRRWETRRAPA